MYTLYCYIKLTGVERQGLRQSRRGGAGGASEPQSGLKGARGAGGTPVRSIAKAGRVLNALLYYFSAEIGYEQKYPVYVIISIWVCAHMRHGVMQWGTGYEKIRVF